MAVVTSTFATAAGTVWASPTWSVNDPSGKVNIQLVNWVAEINDPSKIEIALSPGTCSTRNVAAYVAWLLRMREGDTSSDYGVIFKHRYAGADHTSPASLAGTYYGRIPGTANNGYGTVSGLNINASTENFASSATTVLTAYEATGSTPWFLYAWENNARTARRIDLLLRCDTTNIVSGSYYPSSGLGKWIYVIGAGNSADSLTPQSSILAPYKGINSGNTYTLRHPTPAATFGTNHFFRLGSQYGNNHYLGDVTNDILVSNTTTGQFGDTMVLSSVTYTCIGNLGPACNYWVKTSA